MHPNASNEKQVTSAIDRAYRQSEGFRRTSGLGTTGEPFGNLFQCSPTQVDHVEYVTVTFRWP